MLSQAQPIYHQAQQVITLVEDYSSLYSDLCTSPIGQRNYKQHFNKQIYEILHVFHLKDIQSQEI